MYKPVTIIPTAELEALARDSASAWAARQHLHDFLAPDDDLAMAAMRASARQQAILRTLT